MRTILFLEQQGWLGGAQRVLDATLNAIGADFECICAFPEEGAFRSSLRNAGFETLDFPIGQYQPGQKSMRELVRFICRSLYCGARLARDIRRRRIALVYINGPRCLLAGVLAARLTGTPAIFHLHLILTRRPETLLARIFARRCSRILACSRAAALSLCGDRRLAEKIQVLYNPLPQQRRTGTAYHTTERRSPQKQRWTLGVVGRITECKGHHLLLRALAALPAEMRAAVRLLVVGAEAPGCEADIAYARKLRADARAYEIDGQILWVGHQADLQPFYAAMDVLVHPALLEGMCIAILEALDCGIPVIAFNTGGIPEVVRDGHNGMLVPSIDEHALCRTLKLFLENRELRETLRAGARCGLDPRFSMDAFTTAVRAVVEDVCPLDRAGKAPVLAQGARR